MKVFYHNDLDGRCAGAIAYRYYGKTPQITLIEIDYKDEIDVDAITKDEKIVIVDFSFKPEAMERVLEKTKNVIWIDHHKTAFEYKYSKELDGERDVEFSGCELAWKYWYPEKPMPRAVELIGDRDKWAWKYGKETADFNMGMKTYDHQPKDMLLWENLFNENRHVLNDVKERGRICLLFRDMFCKDYADSYGFETEYGGYKCFAMGLYMFGSEAFGDRMDKHDICLSFVFDGKKWTVGLYSKTIDVSEIAKKNGGGGHRGAAGFVCDSLPFKKQ